MKEKMVAWTVLIVVVLAGLTGVLAASVSDAASPATAAARPESEMVHYLTSSQKEGVPSPPMMWTANFSDFMIPVPMNPEGDQTSYLVDWGDGTSTGWIGPYDPGVTVTVSHVWDIEGSYQMTITAKNEDGVSDTAMYTLHLSSTLSFFFVSLGYVGIPYLFTLHLGDNMFYLFDWGDGNLSDWLGPMDTVVAQHTWSTAGVYSVRWKTKDVYGTETPWSDPFLVTIAIPGVQPPSITIEGPSWGIVNVAYTFTINTTDEWLYCLCNWGDGNTTGWVGPYSPGEYNFTHAWVQRGVYSIRMKFKNPDGVESGWVTHDITIFELKRALIFGRLTNRSAGAGYIIIHAVNLHLILFLPPKLLHYQSGENVTFFTAPINTMILTPSFIVGFIRVVY